jgi:hypothetical protein
MQSLLGINVASRRVDFMVSHPCNSRTARLQRLAGGAFGTAISQNGTTSDERICICLQQDGL